jgi:hypothetical protein
MSCNRLKAIKYLIAIICLIYLYPSVYALGNQTGWPYYVGNSLSSPIIVNLDGNLSTGLEIVLSRGPGIHQGRGRVYAFYYTNETLFPSGYLEVSTDGESIGPPAVGDLMGDGKLSVVVGSSLGKIYAWYYNGSGVLNQSGLFTVTGNNIQSSPVLVDLDSNISNGLEILVGLENGSLQAWYSNGSLMWSKSVGGAIYSISVADLDGDSAIEIVAGSGDSKVYALHWDGAPVSGWPVDTGGPVVASPATCDLDRDGYPEIITGSEDFKVYAWRHDGTALAGWPVTTYNYVESSPSCGDLNGDGYLEVVVGSRDHSVYVWNYNGTLLDGWPKSTEGNVDSSPALGDVDGDGSVDVVVGSSDGKVYAWSFNGSNIEGWPIQVDSQVGSSPAIGDTDLDNKTEVIVTTQGAWIYVWETGVYNKSKVLWPMFRQNPAQTASVHPIVKIISPQVIGWFGAYEDSLFSLNLSSITFPYHSAVTFNGSAFYPNGEILAYHWSSDINGSIGNSSDFIIETLKRGYHRITLTISTDDGSSGSATGDLFIYNGQVNFSDNTSLFEINSSTGYISFIPDNWQVGDYGINITVSDSEGVLGSKTFYLTIFNTNDPPLINTTSPQTIVNEDTIWSYDFNATDDDVDAGYGDTLTWYVNNTKISIDPSTGFATWIPGNSEVGYTTINITVEDSEGESDTLIFDVYVNNTNDPPVLEHIGPQTAITNHTFYLKINASDIDKGDNDTLIFSDDTPLFDINSTTGEINFTPTLSQAGNTYFVNISVRDSSGAVDYEIVQFFIDYEIKELDVSCSLNKENYYVNENVTLECTVTNYYGQNATADIVQAIITTPCGEVWKNLTRVGDNIYKAIIDDSFIQGNYTLTIYANKSNYTSGEATLSFEALPPATWHYYKNVTVNSGTSERENAPIKLELNFTYEISSVGGSGTFDNNSIRIYEVDSQGNEVAEVEYLFEKSTGEPGATNIALGKTATASSSYGGGYEPWRAVDGNKNTMWGTDCGSCGCENWLKIDLGEKRDLSSVKIIGWEGYSHPKDYTIQVSEDDITYTTVITVVGSSTYSSTHQFPPGVSGRWVKISITDNGGAYGWCSETYVEELEVYPLINAYNASTNAIGNLTWILKNITPPNSDRFYQIRFDTIENGEKKAPGYQVNYSGLQPAEGLNIYEYSTYFNQPPIALIEANNSTLRNRPLTLNGSGSYDPEGDELQYIWNLGDCSRGLGEYIVHTFTANTSSDLGVKNVTLSVYDKEGGAGIGSFLVEVSNEPPTLYLGNMTFIEDNFSVFYVNASDIDQLSFSATIIPNLTKFNINATGAISFTPDNWDVGNYTVNVSVSDGLVTVSDTASLEIVNVNDPPALEEIGKLNATQDEPFYYDVNASDDDIIHGDVLSFYDNTTLFDINESTGVISFTPNNSDVGIYSINISVTDGEEWDFEEILFRVANINDPPNITQHYPQYNPTINETQNFTFNVTAIDPDGDPLFYTWYLDGSKVADASGSSWTYQSDYNSSGVHEVKAIVDDISLAAHVSWNITVLNVNRPPIITILSPTNHSYYIESQKIEIVSSAQDPDGDQLNYSIMLDGVEISNDSNYSYTWSYESAGNHTINITVTDSNGASASESIVVFVTEPDISLNSSEVYFSDSLVDGRRVLITATVSNLGNASTSQLYLFFYDGNITSGGYIGKQVFTLQPYSVTNVSVYWTPSYGNHTITLYADPNQVAPNYETSSENNLATKEVYVKAKPDLAIYPENIIIKDSNLVEGDNISIEATIINENETDVSSFIAELRVDNIVKATKELSVSGNSNTTTSFSWIVLEGEQEISIVIDPEDVIDEGNESNNQASVKITGTRGSIDLTPPVIRVFNPSNGSSINIFNNTVKGEVSDRSGIDNITLKLNGDMVDSWNTPGTFLEKVSYSLGKNIIEIIATDALGHSSTKEVEVEVLAPYASFLKNASEKEFLEVDVRNLTSTLIEFMPETDSLLNITIEAGREPSDLSARPMTSAYGLESQYSLNKFVKVDITKTNDGSGANVSWALLKIYYSEEDLDRTGDGEGGQSGDISEDSLRLYWYSESEEKWIPLSQEVGLVEKGAPDVYSSGINKAENYIWANLSHFSVYGVAGDPITEGYNSGSGYSRPPVVFLANSIDGNISKSFISFLEKNGVKIIHVDASNFSEFKKRRYILILGGPDAYEGVGDIVSGILTENEKEAIRKGEKKLYISDNVWEDFQTVILLAGRDRWATREVCEENKYEVLRKIR